jgi:hypothetical protein
VRFRFFLSPCLGLLVFVSVTGFVSAGDFHIAGSLVCSDCHTMQFSVSHTYGGSPTPAPLLGAGGPFPKLLKNTQGQLCLSCHDGKTDAPDVRGANTGSHIRAAGQLNVAGDNAEGTGHTMGSTTAPPGGNWNNPGLQCSHCHDTHGNSYYRNLIPNPGTASGKNVTYVTGAGYSGTAAIQQMARTPMATQYATSNIRYRQSQVGSSDVGLSEWCGGCHGDFHGLGGATNMGGSTGGDTGSSRWLRHPARYVTQAEGVTNRHIDSGHWFSSLASRVPVVSPSDTIPGTASGSDNEVFCGSCHKAHGSQNRKGLIFDNDSTPAAEDGTSLNQTCQQCHYQ